MNIPKREDFKYMVLGESPLQTDRFLLPDPLIKFVSALISVLCAFINCNKGSR